MNPGKLYGIGVGPGDPRLLTLKAIDTMRLCDVIAVPEPVSSERTAFGVIENYVEGKPILPCGFSMHRNEQHRVEQRQETGKRICELLESRKSVGFITLGDPMIYSTYSYVREYAVSRGFETETIPGITSFSAAAAALNMPLCEGNEALHILPAGCGENIEQWIHLPGTKVIMKSGKNFSGVLEILRQHGFARQTRVALRCTMEDQKIFETLDDFDSAESDAEPDYFSLILVKEKRS